MKRRGFLGFIGGAAVAGPGMARAAVTPVAESLSIPGVGMSAVYGGMPSGPIEESDVVGEVVRLRARLARYIGRSAEELARERKTVSAHTLDPDLAAMRSMSLDYRMRMQRERNFALIRAQETGWIEQRIHDLLNPS